MNSDWIEDCMKWRGKVLRGKYSHWCLDWDGLPIDETCQEWPCLCFNNMNWRQRLWWNICALKRYLY